MTVAHLTPYLQTLRKASKESKNLHETDSLVNSTRHPNLCHQRLPCMKGSFLHLTVLPQRSLPNAMMSDADSCCSSVGREGRNALPLCPQLELHFSLTFNLPMNYGYETDACITVSDQLQN